MFPEGSGDEEEESEIEISDLNPVDQKDVKVALRCAKLNRRIYKYTYLKFVTLVPEENESNEAIAIRVFKVVFPAVNHLEIRGKFVAAANRSTFQRVYRCAYNRSVLNNKTAPKSGEC